MRTERLRLSSVSAVIAALVVSTAAFAAQSTIRYLYFHVKSPVPRGQLAHVVVQGLTGLCRITVSKEGSRMRLRRSTLVNPLAPKLSKREDDNRVAWQWWVPANTPLGRWRVRVDCGRAQPLQGTFSVIR
jgi:hypothetical protein